MEWCGRRMGDKPRLLDLFCGAGGAAMGYHRAGFEVVGVDIKPQPRFPFEFHQADAMTYPLGGFDVIHASPPCQAYVGLSTKDGRHPRLVEPTQGRLRANGLPYVIENTGVAPLRDPGILCGSMFGLHVRRHRKFETNVAMLWPQCRHGVREIRGYYGRNYGPALVSKDAIRRRGRKPLYRGTVAQAHQDMGIDWMEWDELREAIPPAYTEWIGRQLMALLPSGAVRLAERLP